MAHRSEVMLDSGAFSVWNLNAAPIDLKQYIAFIKAYEKHLFSYVTLDVLPPGKESARTREANEEGARLSDINHQTMKDAGLTPIPVFHQGETFKWLENMLKNGEPVIGVSTRKDLPPDSSKAWLDDVWSVLADGKGRPLVKTHGFGITAIPLLLRYPWWTVDSTTWAMVGGLGCIYVPQEKHGAPDYSQPPIVVRMSTMASRGANEHFDSLGGEAQEWIIQYLEGELGVSLTRVRSAASGRQEALVKYYLNFIKARGRVRFKQHRRGFFGNGMMKHDGAPVRINQFRIMFVISLHLGHYTNKALNDAGATTRLMTYYEVRDRDPEIVLGYIETGVRHPPRKLKQNWYKEEYLSRRKLSIIERLQEDELGLLHLQTQNR